MTNPPELTLEQLRDIARELRVLQKSSPTTAAGIAAWDAKAREFTQRLNAGPELDLPEEVMHYLHDADLRVKDPELRFIQDRSMDVIISELERGNIPEPTTFAIRVDPRWFVLGFVALIAISLALWK